MIRRLIGFATGSWVKTAVWYFVAFCLGAIVNNGYATRNAVQAASDSALTYAAEREAAVGAAYAKAAADYNAKLAEDQKRRDDADHDAHVTYQAGIVAAARARSNAERALASLRAEDAKRKETIDGIRAVNQILAAEMQSVPECSFSGDLRRVLDQASGADGGGDPAGDAPIAEADRPALPAGSAGTGAAAPPLTCDQLQDGYIAVSQWGARGWNEAVSWQMLWGKLFGN